MAIVFNTIAKRGPSRFHRKTIQIAGIGSMVYAALVVTPMHDVLVGVALLFFVTAMVTIFHRLYLERRFGMLGAGIACLALTLCNATMYYGAVLRLILPSSRRSPLSCGSRGCLGLLLSDSQTVNRVGQAYQSVEADGAAPPPLNRSFRHSTPYGNPMQRLCTLTVILCLLHLGCSSSTAAGPDESKEPPLEFVVDVGDKSITVTEGTTANSMAHSRIRTSLFKPQPYRVFPYGGITFKYPRSFAFEADLADLDRKNWTLSGNDLKLMYFLVNARLTTDEFADNMIEQFGRENCKVTDANAKIILGKQTLPGTTIQIAVASHKMVMDIYRIPSPGGVTKLVVFQDSLDNAGNRSNEGVQAVKEMKSSFTVEQ